MSKPSDRGTKRQKLSKPSEREPAGEIEEKECGCREQKFTDETSDKFPCIPHALQQTASSLAEAANALGYVGVQLEQAGARQRAMKELNDEVDKGIEDGSIS